MANDKFIEEITDKLKDHVSEVSPQLWQGISAQIGTGTSAGAVAGYGVAKVVGLVCIVLATVAVVYIAVAPKQNSEQSKNKTREVLSLEKMKAPPLSKVSTKEIAGKSQNDNVVEQKKIRVPLERMEEKTAQKINPHAVINPPLAPENVLSIKEKQRLLEPSKTNSEMQSAATTVGKVEEMKKSVVEETENQVELKPLWEIKSLPNIFTPNNDGVNDFFFIESKGLSNYVLVVMDMNNKVVWQTEDQNARWDGTHFGGDKLPKGNYLYIITAEDAERNRINKYQRLQIQ